MARNLEVGERVLVPKARVGLSYRDEAALYRSEVVERLDRSVRVNLPNGGISEPVATSAVHRNLGLWILRIGDFDTEYTLLDPLTKSVLQFLRLLMPDDAVLLREVRSLEELSYYWGQDHAAYSHIIAIGHGRRNAIRFGANDWVDAEALAAILEEPSPSRKAFVSLCCETGYAAFSKKLSSYGICRAVIAPYHDVHGAIASQFCQTYFSYHLLEGETISVAYKHAREAVPGGAIFRMWRRKELHSR